MKKLSLVLVLVLSSLATLVAQRTISGTVTDDQSEALIGATVLVEGTSTGTVTDIDGNYSLDVPADGKALIISYTGYSTAIVEIGAGNVVDVVLSTDVIGLEDVIVVGYAPTRRKDVTGSVTSVNGDDISDESGVGIQTALRGRAPGVTVVQNSGTPGGAIDVRVRGSTSISANNRPLYVIDGVPVIDADFSQDRIGGQGTNTLSDINPADIESIEVLKDASTAAIYGSRGANGVVLITTKKGKAGATRIDFNASYGLQEAIKTIPIVDSAGYRAYLTEGYGAPIAAGALQGNSNWQDLILEQGTVEDYNLSVSGGSEETRFFASMTYHDNEGILRNSRFRRYAGRLNLEHFAGERFTMGMNIGFTHSITNRIQNDNNIYGAISTSILLPPTVPVFNEDGSYGSAFGLENPVAAVDEYSNIFTNNRIIGNVFGQFNITDDLSVRATLGVDALDLREDVFEPSVLQSTTAGTANYGTTNNLRLINEYTLTYRKRFGNNSLTAVAGVGFQEDKRDRTFVSINDFPTDNFTALDAGAAPQSITGDFSGDNLQSYFANANFSIDDRYIITATFRTDGSSRFVNNKWGYFPGVAVAWRLSNEDFLANSPFDDLKLRLSYGQTGNNSIGNFQARQFFAGGFNYKDTPGIAPSQLGNPDLKWETTTQINAGVDFSLANSRINTTIDFYVKNTEDLLLDRPIPTTSGFTTVPQNIGEMRNTGVELSLNTVNFRGDFNWNTTFNIAYNDNEILSLFNDQPIDVGFASRIAVGQPLGAFYGWVTDGIFQNQAEIDGHAFQTNGTAPGDFRFVDLNGDNVINDQDRTFIGAALPDLTGGLTSNMSYKGISLDLFFQFALGNEIYNNNLAFAEGLNSIFAPTQRSFDGAWREEGQNTIYPRVAIGDPNLNRRDSDRFAEDGSYIRLKTATLAYQFPSSMFGNSGIRNLRIFVAGTNLLTWTDYSWFDPEVNTFTESDDSNGALGTDFLTYPQAQSVSFGLNLGF